MIPIPPFVINLAAKYGSRAIAIIVLLLTITAGYYYWKHEVATEARDDAIADCNESKNRFRIDAEHFKLARQEEVNKLNKEQSERVQNAIKTYIDHYAAIASDPITITSVRVKTNTAGACIGSLPGAGKDRSKGQEGIAGTGEAELPERNQRSLDATITDIERMQLLCEKDINTVP